MRACMRMHVCLRTLGARTLLQFFVYVCCNFIGGISPSDPVVEVWELGEEISKS